MEKIILNKDANLEENFFYAYSPHARSVAKFNLHEDHVSNYLDGRPDAFSYISIISKEKYGEGTRVATKCSFGKFGAPLIVFAGELKEGRNDMKLYDLHFEVVAYEGGFNVWHIVPDYDNAVRPIKSTKIAFEEFEILPDELIDIEVVFRKKKIEISINGKQATVEHKDFPETFHVGITGCEGPNKFYELEIN